MREFKYLKEWLIQKSKETNYRQVGELVGLHHTAIKKICDGEMTNPTLLTMTKIQNAMTDDLNKRWDGIIVQIPKGPEVGELGGKDGKLVRTELTDHNDFMVTIHPLPERGKFPCLGLTGIGVDPCCETFVMDKDTFIDFLQGAQIYLR